MWSFSWFDQKGQSLLTSLNCSERAKFEDDSAVSLATSGSESSHFIFYSGKLPSRPYTIVMRERKYAAAVQRNH